MGGGQPSKASIKPTSATGKKKKIEHISGLETEHIDQIGRWCLVREE